MSKWSLHDSLLALEYERWRIDLCFCSDKEKVSKEIAAEMSRKQKTGEFAKNKDAIRCIVIENQQNLNWFVHIHVCVCCF